MTLISSRPGRDLKTGLRLQRPVSPPAMPKQVTSPARSRRQFMVATLSRLFQVATLKRGRDIVSAPSEQARSRPQNQVATPSKPDQVATSNRCRDQPPLPPQKRPCCDPKPWSRRQTLCGQSSQVVTSISGRDLKLANPSRDLVSIQLKKNKSRHQTPNAPLATSKTP